MTVKMKVTARELVEMTEKTGLQKVIDFLTDGIVSSAKCGYRRHGVYIISRDADGGVFTAKNLLNYSARLEDVIESLGNAGFTFEIKEDKYDRSRGLKSFIIQWGEKQ